MCADLLHASYYQRRGRGAKIQDCDSSETRLRLSQSKQPQDRHLLPLRRSQPIPGCRDTHESRMNHIPDAYI